LWFNAVLEVIKLKEEYNNFPAKKHEGKIDGISRKVIAIC